MRALKQCLLLFFVFLFLSFDTEAQDWSEPVFGAVEASVRPDEAAALGVSWERLTFHWNAFQPNGPEDFNPDAISGAALDSARAAGRQVVGLIQGTPPWASASGSPAGVPNGLNLPQDDPNNYFANFVRRLVEFYSQRGIHHWIIWNEPDIRPGEGPLAFEGEVEDYALLLKSGYLAANSVDSRVHIQIAGTSWWYDSEHGREPYLQRLLRVISADPESAGNGWYFDGISVHIYFTSSSVWTILNANQQILNQFGLGEKELWLNEFNASPRRDPVTPLAAPFNISLEQQADFVVQASALALAAGVDRLAVYKLFDNDFIAGQTEAWGLVRHDGSLRPAFHAYQQVINQFQYAGNVRRYSINEASLITLQNSNRTLYILWNDTFEAGQFLIDLNSSQEVTVSDAVGNQWQLSPETINGGNVLVLDAPAAERIDADWVVVSGAVRLISLSGSTRVVAFRTAQGSVIRLNG